MCVISVQAARDWLFDGQEIAFLDLREAGEFGEGHPFLATPLPYSRLELDIHRLVPRRSTRLLLIDAGNGISIHAAAALNRIGYSDVSWIAGGTEEWAAAGYVLFQGVNLPSKTFGELVEHRYETPRITAQELHDRVGAGENIVILDGRPLAEFHKMSIPGAICCPNGELALRFPQLVPDAATTVVINCAGRTRSIIGAQTLIDLGVPNPVLALENGTQGWYLADLPLNHGRQERYPDTGSQTLRKAVEALSAQNGVKRADAAMLRTKLEDDGRTTYLLDIRTEAEVARAAFPGAIHAPGGQLIQSTDQYIGTRNARLVLIDTDGIRAPVVASWLRRLGHDAELAAPETLPPAVDQPEAPRIAEITPVELKARLSAETIRLIDLRSSAAYREAHVAGAEWSIRPRLDRASNIPAVLISDDPGVAAIAAKDLGVSCVRLVGGPDEWRQAELALESTPDLPADADRVDFLFFVHDRHDGNKEAAHRYLEWETGLVAQLDADERALFHFT